VGSSVLDGTEEGYFHGRRSAQVRENT